MKVEYSSDSTVPMRSARAPPKTARKRTAVRMGGTIVCVHSVATPDLTSGQGDRPSAPDDPELCCGHDLIAAR